MAFTSGADAMPLTPKEETVTLGFGADEKIKVTRVAVRKNEGSAGSLTSSKTDEQEYKITVRNGHDSAIRIRVEDRIPVSQTEDVEVELLPVTTPPTQRDVADKPGMHGMDVRGRPGEARDLTPRLAGPLAPHRPVAYDF